MAGRPKLPRRCKDCGDTDPAHFYADRPSQCKSCYHIAKQPKFRLWYRNVLKSRTITRKVLTYVEMRLRWGFEAPSLEEIAGAVRVSVPTVLWHIEALERDGKIIREPRKHRGLRIA